MHLISWNVNGIRAVLRKNFLDFLNEHNPDVICLQEVKAHEDQVEESFDGYHAYWNSAERKGYSGTLTLSKTKPISVLKGMGKKKFDDEGRVLTVEYRSFYLVNVYVPNAKRDLSRLPYRIEWDKAFRLFLKKLEKTKPVIFCGDMNVAHEEIDLTYPKRNRKNHGFTDEERAGFSALVKAGFIDTFREFEKESGHYTWWSQMPGVREKNIGWRLDYFGISELLGKNLKSAKILSEVFGSDHCPVEIVL